MNFGYLVQKIVPITYVRNDVDKGDWSLTSDYEIEHYNLQLHSYLTPLYLYIHEMDFGILSMESHTNNLMLDMLLTLKPEMPVYRPQKQRNTILP